MTRSPRATDSPSPDSAHLRIPWPALSIGLAIVALVSLGTLAVIVSVKNVDILSTVALAIAILSFAAQLIVSMLQTESSAKLNGSTESALAEMRATTDSLLTNQRDQFDRVLGAALKAIPAAVDDVVGSSESGDGDEPNGGEESASADAFQQSLSMHMREILEHPIRATWHAADPSPSLPSDLDQYPDKQSGTAALAKLRSLDPMAIPPLIRVAEKVRAAEKNGRSPVANFTSNSGKPGPYFQTIIDAGLVKRSLGHGSDAKRSQYSLTDDGRTVARLLVAKGTKPKWLNDAQAGPSE